MNPGGLRLPGLAVGAFGALCVAVASCGGGDDGGGPPVDACATVSYDQCDIASSACAMRVFAGVACIRGAMNATPPPVRTITEAQYAAEIRDFYTTMPLNPFYLGARRLLLFDPGSDTNMQSIEDLIAQAAMFAAAFYDPDTKGVTIVSHATPLDAAQAQLILAHEFVHAQQDSEIDLNMYFDAHVTSYDEELAVRAFVEGEADMYQNVYALKRARMAVATARWDDYYAMYQQFVEMKATDATSIIDDADAYFQYAYGGKLMITRYLAGGVQSVRDAYAKAPRGTIDILAPPGPATLEPPPDPVLDVPDGYTLQLDDTLGALDVHAFLARNGLGGGVPETDWRGDHLVVYGKDGTPPSTVVLWQLRFGTTGSAQAVVQAASRMMMGARARLSVDQRGVDILLAETADEVALFATALGFP